ncbi:MAG TPA: calcium-binding protein [Polyangiales bacterium]|nr:calcium-binding protein [Polyangiales bacterium]
MPNALLRYTTLASILALAACSGGGGSESDEPDAGDMPGSNEDGSAGSGGNTEPMSGDAGRDAAEPVVSDDAPDPAFEGVASDSIPYGSAPVNCTTNKSNEDGTLVLELSADVKVLWLSANSGEIRANGVGCTTVLAPKLIKILGSSASEYVIVDFSVGEFPDSVKDISVDLGTGAGKDTLAISATRKDDDVQLGRSGAASLIRVTSRPQLSALNQETLIVSTGPGADRIDATGVDMGSPLGAAVSMYGGAGDDVLTGGASNDALYGGAGDDVFRTGAAPDGGDLYDGGDGDDMLSYDLRKNPVAIKVDNMPNDGEANERDDVKNTIETLVGGAGNDTIIAGDIDNRIIGGAGNDLLYGGAGNDVFTEADMALGSDIINGGPDIDEMDYSERAADLHVALCISSTPTCSMGPCGCQADDGEAGEDDNLINIENVLSGKGNDTLIGSAADNLLRGNDGDDELRGEGGDDTLYGEHGKDVLNGGPGEDLLDGDEGADDFDGGGGDGDICIRVGAEPLVACELF